MMRGCYPARQSEIDNRVNRRPAAPDRLGNLVHQTA